MIIYKKSEPFVYLIGWTSFNRFYIGSRYSRDSHPNQLWTKYFTSSKAVKTFRQEFGEPDVIEIRKIFNSGKEAHNYEIKLLQRIGAVKDDRFLNLNDIKNWRNPGGKPAWNRGVPMPNEQKERQSRAMKGKPGWSKGIPRTEEEKEKIRIKRKDQIITEETKRKISLAMSGENNPMFGKKHTEGALIKMRGHDQSGENNGMFGKKHSEETKEKMKIPKSEETKQRMRKPKSITHPCSEAAKEKLRKPKEKVTCPYCQKTGGKSAMMRWHFDNCKNKP